MGFSSGTPKKWNARSFSLEQTSRTMVQATAEEKIDTCLKSSRLRALLLPVREKGGKQEILTFFKKDVYRYLREIENTSYRSVGRSSSKRVLEQVFCDATDRFLAKADILSRVIQSRLILVKVKRLFRELAGDLICKGAIAERALKKPRGYPGDYLLLEMLYDNFPLGNGFGGYCDNYILKDGYVSAVRKRKDKMRTRLEHFIKSSSGTASLSILNLGSGACRELREISRNVIEGKRKITFFLLDQDEEALTFASRLLKRSFSGIDIRLIKANVLDFARNGERFCNMFGDLDLIYSVGLADYIPDFYLEGLIKVSFGLLKKGGTFILAHKDLSKHKSIASDWLCDWTFLPRTIDDLLLLVHNTLKGEDIKYQIETLASGHVFFLTLTKPHTSLRLR